MKRMLTVLIIFLMIFAFLAALNIHGSYKGVYEKTLRLHVLADSDEKEDQFLKLKVRDAILNYVTPFLEPCKTREDAENKVKTLLPEIENISEKELEKHGSKDKVKAVLGKEYYPTRKYEGFRFPEGEYLSLRIFIGSGEGHNWWCVLYPPLCLSASEASGEALENSDLTSKEQELVMGKYKVRFFLLELYSKGKKMFSSLF